jgi:5-methylcytosine-specific restriction endonuclease McrA
MSLRTLILTPWMQPHRLATWQDGVVLAVTEKGDVLEAYEAICASPSITLAIPAVVRLRKEIHANKRGVKFSRSNIYQRDGHRCCYCPPSAGRYAPKDLTYDHVLPRSRGGVTDWTNIVTCCKSHNTKKDRKTPAEAGMHMHFQPYKPRVLPMTAPFLVDIASMPEQWGPYVHAMARAAG